MRTIDTLKHICAWVACLGVLSPAATFGAAPEVQMRNTQAAATTIQDVELSTAGTLNGQIVDQQGEALAGVPVTIASNSQTVATTTTDAAGKFSIGNLSGGTYQVASVGGQQTYRAWQANTAPPAASTAVMLVASQQVVRGQCAGGCGGNGMQGAPQYSQAYGQPMGGEVMQGQVMQGQVYGQPMAQGEYVQGAPMAEGAAVQGQPIYGPWVQGQPIPVGEPAYGGVVGGPAYGGPAAPMSGGGGGFGFLANPWIIGGVVAAAIAIPLALDDDDEDFRPPSS